MREDERGGIKKRQKRRKGTRKEKSSKNDRGTQTTLSGRLRGSSATRRDNDSGSRKDQAKEKKRSGKKLLERKQDVNVLYVKRSEDDVSDVELQ